MVDSINNQICIQKYRAFDTNDNHKTRSCIIIAMVMDLLSPLDNHMTKSIILKHAYSIFIQVLSHKKCFNMCLYLFTTYKCMTEYIGLRYSKYIPNR